VDEGDEVILVNPSFVSYERLIHLCNATPVPLSLREENGFQISKEELQSKVTEKTKLIIINNPCNPTGVLFTPNRCRLSPMWQFKTT
jgi:aspartate/methionine/tyrosine aminotransferase